MTSYRRTRNSAYGRHTRPQHSRRFLLNQPVPDDDARLISIARRYARCDRQLRPIYCDNQGKLTYDTEDIAIEAAEALEQAGGTPRYAYACPHGAHFHLASERGSRGQAS